ncbi:MAG TPA: branched-chain amino acid ABC transporter permease [Acidimicrobiales bacterium]|nr:branched-chain amino acid ABC transporter permease [Acidimicrobiales bacterium]
MAATSDAGAAPGSPEANPPAPAASGRTAGAVDWPRWIRIAVILVVGLTVPLWVGDYWLSTLGFVVIAAIGALGLDVLTGWTGQISLGHAFFLAAGAYVAGWLGASEHLNAAIAIPLAGVAAGALGALVGPAALRLRGLYLGIVTIGLVYIGQYVAQTWTSFSGGSGGRSLPDPKFGSLDFANGFHVGTHLFDRNACYYYLAFLLLALAMLYVHNLARTKVSRDMTAVRDRELAAAVLGVDVARTKVRAFVISSAMAGIAGALYGSFIGFVNPQTWGLVLSIQYVIMIVVGGMASLWGPLLGAVFVIGFPSVLQRVSSSLTFLSNGSNQGVISPTDAADIAFGALLIVFLILEPRGVMGLVRRIGGLMKQSLGRSVPR